MMHTMHALHTNYDPFFVVLSVVVAVFASYVALDLAGSVTQAKGRLQAVWLAGGALAMGFGIWSMHFIGMLAFDMPGMQMGYDLPLLVLSIVISIVASALALYIVSRPVVPIESVLSGGVAMAAAIAGMHYTGMYSMRMGANVAWDGRLVIASVVISLVASFAALFISIRLRKSSDHFAQQMSAAILMGCAISGMHYTGMAAATFSPAEDPIFKESDLIATDALAYAVTGATLFILGVALASSIVNRALSRRTRRAEESARLFEEADRAIAQLMEERSLRERFVSALAHDLRTPLAAAKMSAQLAIRGANNPDDVLTWGRKSIDNLQRADQMIQDLLDANRISAGRPLPLTPAECGLEELLHETLDSLTTVYGDRFRLDIPKGLRGHWDLRYLRRALENLCSNAVKYGSKTAPVTVKAWRIDGTPELVRIEVHNEGEGLTTAEKKSLFAIFHRGASAQKSGQRGWGLGLTLVRGVAETHGGKVEIESEPASGTTFRLLLPLDSRPHAAASGTEYETERPNEVHRHS